MTGPNVAAIGWEACPVEWWIDIADQLERSGAAWVESAALMDLRFWCGQVRLGRRKRIPSRRRLAARWHWTDHAVRCLLRSAQWSDLHFAQNPPKDRPKVAQNSPSFDPKTQDQPSGAAHFSPKTHPKLTQNPPQARSTQTPPQTQTDIPAGRALDQIMGDGRDLLWPDLVRDLLAAGYQTVEELAAAGRDAWADDLGRRASVRRLNKIERVLSMRGISAPSQSSTRQRAENAPSAPHRLSNGPDKTLIERYAAPAASYPAGSAPWDLVDYTTGDRKNGKR